MKNFFNFLKFFIFFSKWNTVEKYNFCVATISENGKNLGKFNVRTRIEKSRRGILFRCDPSEIEDYNEPIKSIQLIGEERGYVKLIIEAINLIFKNTELSVYGELTIDSCTGRVVIPNTLFSTHITNKIICNKIKDIDSDARIRIDDEYSLETMILVRILECMIQRRSEIDF